MTFTFRYSRPVKLAFPALCCALSLSVAACGDDDGGTDVPEGGAGGTSAGTAGKASSGSANGGKTNGGTDQGDAGEPPAEGGKGGTTSGGTTSGGTTNGGTTSGGTTSGGTANGGSAGEPDPGAAGEGGEGGGPLVYHPAKVNGPDGTLVPQVNDLRGVTYSATGGKIWAVGHVGVSTTYPTGVDRHIAVVRFLGDGTLDKSFDGDGIKTINLRSRQGVDENITNDGDEYCMGVVELPNGDLIIQANRRDALGKGREVVLLKMTPFGGLINFGAGPNNTGAAATVRKVDFGWTDVQRATFPGAPDVQPSDEGWGIALNPDGTKVVVFGYGPAPFGAMNTAEPPAQRTDNDRYVVQLNVATGLPDAAFNAGKPYTFNTGGVQNDNARRGKVEADGAIVSSGYTNVGGANTIFVLRLSSTGVPDATFTAGTAAIPGVWSGNPFAVDGGIAECYAAGRQSTGRYVTTGYGRATAANTLSTFDPPWRTTESVDMVSFGLMQGATGGTLDTSFGRQGTLAVQSEGLNMASTEDRGRDLVVLPDDRVVFAARLGNAPALIVTTEDGELDDTEGGATAGPGGTDTVPGVYTYAPLSGTTSHFYAIALSPDKTRVAAVTNNHADGVLLAILDVQ